MLQIDPLAAVAVAAIVVIVVIAVVLETIEYELHSLVAGGTVTLFF